MVDISGLTMVYGRYNYSIHGDYFMVYKPTFTSLGKTHPVSNQMDRSPILK
jgi:hypothetical protein